MKINYTAVLAMIIFTMATIQIYSQTENNMTITTVPKPSQSHMIKGGGNVNLAVQEWGNPTGKPVLFIHAWSQSHLGWLPQLNSELATAHRLITFDLRGHGQSEVPSDPASYTDAGLWADDINAIIEALELDDVTLVAWSLGRLVAQNYIAKYGTGKLHALNIVGGFNAFNIPRAQSHIGTLVGGSMTEMMAPDLGTELNATIATTKKLYVGQINGDALAFVVGYQMVTRPAVRYAMVTQVVDHEKTIRALDIPLLLTHGAQDDISDVKSAKDAKSFNSTAKLSIYKKAGHAPHAYDPARFNRELKTLVDLQ